MNKAQLTDDIRAAINRNSAESGSDTPDYILAEYLMACLEAFDKTVKLRSEWYGHHCCISGCNHLDVEGRRGCYRSFGLAGPIVELPQLNLAPRN